MYNNVNITKDFCEKIDKELVIVCHCSVPQGDNHKQLYYIKDKDTIFTVGKSVPYVDPTECETDSWDRILHESKTYVWGVACPINMTITNGPFKNEKLEHEYSYSDKMLEDILINAFEVLKHDGKVIFTSKTYKDTMTEHTQEFINTNISLVGKYVVSIINTEDLSFLIGQFHRDEIQIHNSCVIFTKIDAKFVAKNNNNKKKNNKQGGMRVKKNIKTQKHKNTKTQKHKNTKTQKHKNTKTQKHKNTKTQKHKNTKTQKH